MKSNSFYKTKVITQPFRINHIIKLKWAHFFVRACMRAIFLIVCERICKRDQLYSKFPQYIYRFLGDLTFSYFGGAWTRGIDNHQHIHTQKLKRNETETKTEIVNKRQWSISACFCSNKVVSFCLFVLKFEMNEAAIHSKHCWPIPKLNSIKKLFSMLVYWIQFGTKQ